MSIKPKFNRDLISAEMQFWSKIDFQLTFDLEDQGQ